jgi:hypothetical protein
MGAYLEEPFGEEDFLVHRKDNDLQSGIFFYQVGGQAKGFCVGHVDIEYQQVEGGRLHLLDHRFPVFGLIDGYIPDRTVYQEFQACSYDGMIIGNKNVLHLVGLKGTVLKYKRF